MFERSGDTDAMTPAERRRDYIRVSCERNRIRLTCERLDRSTVKWTGETTRGCVTFRASAIAPDAYDVIGELLALIACTKVG